MYISMPNMFVNLGGRSIDPPVRAKRKSHRTVRTPQGGGVGQGNERGGTGCIQRRYRECTECTGRVQEGYRKGTVRVPVLEW